MLWRPFFARVKINYRSIYSRISTKLCAVAMATGLVKNKAKTYRNKILKLSIYCMQLQRKIIEKNNTDSAQCVVLSK